MPDFTCQQCGSTFSLPQEVVDRYPGWTPKLCGDCRGDAGSAKSPRSDGPGTRAAKARPAGLQTTDRVLEVYDDGPAEGVFTDGSSVPNPGPGGWGAVFVVGGEVVAEDFGHDPDTTNNRMELTALIHGMGLVPADRPSIVYTDSRLAVDTITKWASGWEKRGWKRKSGPVENLVLVKKAFYIFRRRPELELQWIQAHVGYRWNEYADALANRWRLNGG
jgi:ribonuclease HI